jgi:DNA adenine methylase
MRPPFVYFGGKTTLAPTIAGVLPPHGHYVEPFAGSLAVLLAKPRSTHETVNDLDGDLVTFWRVLRDRPDDLARVCALTPHSRAEHALSQVTPDGPIDDLETARRVWVQLVQGRAGLRSRNGWRHYQDPAGSSTGMPGYLAGYLGRFAPVAERILGVSLECRPAIDILDDYGRHRDVLLYLDPPYVSSTRTSGVYLHEMTDTEHTDLLEAVLRARATVVLSGYASALYDEALAGWARVEIPSRTGHGRVDSARTEVIWSNTQLIGQQTLDMAGVS